MQFHANRLIFLKIPKEVAGEVEIREFRNKGVSGSVLLCGEKTYRLVCREDSNTFLMKNEDALSQIDLCLECRDLRYGEKEIMDILPEVSLANINSTEMFILKERVMHLYPMTDYEYAAILKRNRSIWKEVSGEIYFARVSTPAVIEVLLLARSLVISKETRKEEEIKNAFREILPEILFQIVEEYIKDGLVDEDEIKKGLVCLFKKISKTKEEFNRNMAINWLI